MLCMKSSMFSCLNIHSDLQTKVLKSFSFTEWTHPFIQFIHSFIHAFLLWSFLCGAWDEVHWLRWALKSAPAPIQQQAARLTTAGGAYAPSCMERLLCKLPLQSAPRNGRGCDHQATLEWLFLSSCSSDAKREEEGQRKQKREGGTREHTAEEKGCGSFSPNYQLPRLLLAERKRKRARLCLLEAFVLLPRLWGKWWD